MRLKNLAWIAPAALAALIAVPAIAQDRPSDQDRRDQQDRRDSRDRRDQGRDYRHTSNLEVHVATTAPPRARHERRPPRPDADSVWVNGYWDWQGARWEWVSGRWERPEERSARWIAPKYRREGNAYRYEPGHWSNQQVVEGDEYHRWKEEHGNDRDHRDRDHDRDH
jgi:hypothetical protein